MNTAKRLLAGCSLILLAASVPGSLSAAPQGARGDANNDGSITLADAICVGQYLFAKGPAPAPTLDSGDANCDFRVDLLDAVYLVSYTVRGGPAPKCPEGSVSTTRHHQVP